jgi:small-conductance mechanosensitive channel
MMTITYFAVCVAVIYGIAYAQEHGGAWVVTGVSFLWAATVFALQNFIASFFTYLYIITTNQYDTGDIIKIGDPRMTSIGEVVEIWLFSTTIKELDGELLFTGRQFTLPNQVFFTAGVYNYTKHNLLFRHTIKTIVASKAWISTDELLDQYRSIIHHTYQEITLKHPERYQHGTIHHPKYYYTISDKGIEIEVRINTHFYNVLELNNLIACRLVDAHRDGVIALVEHKDYRGVFSA